MSTGRPKPPAEWSAPATINGHAGRWFVRSAADEQRHTVAEQDACPYCKGTGKRR